jgi:hypothetical protein
MQLYAVEFELEDFGQNVAHLVGKTYYTHDFFTDRQVYSGITRKFELAGKEHYELQAVPCTIALPLLVEKQKMWFSGVNADFQKEQRTEVLRYISEGYQEYLKPGSRFLAFSFVKPDQMSLFIGKKGALASITELRQVGYTLKADGWTTLDLVYFERYKEQQGKQISEMRLKHAAQRFLVGEFRCTQVLETEYEGTPYRFYTLADFAT